MARQIISPVLDEYENEVHPAWVIIGATRVSHSPPGAVLFDSDIKHQHYVVIRLMEASRKRDLNRDWIHGRKHIVEVAMSEAQWASFVSSMNSGDGVPATLIYRDSLDDPHVPGMPYSPRLQESMAEVHNAATKVRAKVQIAFEAYKEKKNAANLRDLEIAIGHMTPDMDFAAKSLSEHTENVVQRARADIEAFVMSKAKQLGLDPAEVVSPLELEA